MKLIVRQQCWGTFRYYVVFTKSILFILGLIFSYKLVEKTFLNILFTHLTDAWDEKDYDLRRFAILVNVHEGTSAVLVMFFAFVADVYTGRFRMVVFSTTLCIIGLLLNCVAVGWEDAEQLKLELFYPALGLMTLAEAAQTVTLQAFLEDQLRIRLRDATVEDDDTGRRRQQSKFWWTFVSFVAAIFSLFGPLQRLSFGKLAIMGACFFFFLLGFKYYNCIATNESPLTDVGLVILRAIMKRNLDYPLTPEHLFDNSGNDTQIWPHVPWLRWLDRAAIVQENEDAGRPATVEKVKGVKLLLKMLPLWSNFLTLCLVTAIGSTFFFEEAISISDKLFPILFFTNLQRFTEFVVSAISTLIIEKLIGQKKKHKAQRMELVRIGIGMLCCVLCCTVAWANAAHRLRLVQKYNMIEIKSHTTIQEFLNENMSVYRLTPQYLLLGLMGGLSEEGLQNFFESQVSESLSRFGPPLGECMMGMGKFLSILCILIFSKWFHKGLNDSRLDKYYALLAVLSFANVIVYCWVGYWYKDDTFLLSVDVEMGNINADEVVDATLESRSLHGQPLSHRSLSHRTASKPKDSTSSWGDNAAQNSSSSKQSQVTSQAENDQDPLLPSKSTKNYLLLRAVTAFSRLSSRVARKRSD
ncbi:hypothetical protein C2S51_011783 [Perilla frutescens var. frutescens]|nr:hypothetical protein C2S51_011783 [Perilla frutescens var. frutescens]